MKKKTVLGEKLKESLSSVMPVSAVIFILAMYSVPMTPSVFISFLFGTVLMTVGIGLFSLGVDRSMTPMGEYVGQNMTKTKKIWFICLISFIVGVLITISEPDLHVLAGYVPSIESFAFIISVAAGVGAFLIFAILRIIFGIKVKYILLISYSIIFILAIFVKPAFWAVAFDAGGVTTGPISVPFIIAMGVGIASISSDRKGTNDSFGLMALCSAGPIIAILVLGLFYSVDSASYTVPAAIDFANTREFSISILSTFSDQIIEVAKGLFPIVIFFFIYQLFAGVLDKDRLLKLFVGIIYTYFGIVFFLTGVNAGFLPVGSYIGSYLATTRLKWLLIPLGMLLGYFIVSAEPAILVLEKQVEEVTSGTIPKKLLKNAIAIGVSSALGIALLRVITGISIMYFVGAGYLIALVLTFFVPEIFTSIAFDSGGVASGAMASAFLMPLAVGASAALGGNIMEDAFGVIAMVAMFPPITIQILGLVYKIKISRLAKKPALTDDSETIDLNREYGASRIKGLKKIRQMFSGKGEKATLTEYPDIIEFDSKGRW